MLNFLVFFIVLSILVLVHELGHFLAAKKSGIKVEEFGLGYPPRIWSKKKGETVYSFNLIPFGGFVKLFGEELSEGKVSKRTFWAKSKKARIAVITAGVLGNFLLGIICFSSVYSVLGIPTQTDKVKVVEILPDSPAEKSGLQKDDIVLAVDGQSLNNIEHFIEVIGEKKDQKVELLILRQEEQTFSITPRKDPPVNQGPLGVVVSGFEMKKYPFWQMPFRGIVEGFKEAFSWGSLILSSFGKMMADWLGRGVTPKDVAGPIGIFQASSTVTKQGFLAILQFMGVLSINLGILNILPFPALDGGRLLFIVYEIITKKRPKPVIEHWVNLIGMVVLLSLLVLVTINDIRRILPW